MNEDYNTIVTTLPNIYNNNGYEESNISNLYDSFLDSLDEVNDNDLLMTHLSLDIKVAKEHYKGYLTEEELQEKQYEGRFWCIVGLYLYILVDNDTLVVVDDKGDEKIFGRDCLPESLKGRYYYEDYRYT